jgi:hypothetical protein
VFGHTTSDLVLRVGAGVTFGFLAALTDPRRALPSDHGSLDPVAVWRTDRAYSRRVGLVFGVVLTVAITLTLAFVGSDSASTPSLGEFALSTAFLGPVGLVAGLVVGISASASTASALAFLQLSTALNTPVRLMRFLEDAHQRNVLRAVGTVYQFRHARLQDYLGEVSGAQERSHRQPRATGTTVG